MKFAVSTLSLVIFAFPFEVVSGSTDRSGSWTIGPRSKSWCVWANKTDTQNRCTSKNLFDDCPVTCGSRPSTDPSVGSPSTETLGSKIDEVSQNMIQMEERLLQRMAENEERLLQKIIEHTTQTCAPSTSPTSAPTISCAPTASTTPSVTTSTTPTLELSSTPTVSVSSTPTAPTTPTPLLPIVSSGGWHACAIDGLHSLFCWGRNGDGQVGVGSYEDMITTPTEIEVDNEPKEASLGFEHSCLLDALSKVFCWGKNGDGQLGSGDNDNRNAPNEVSLETVPVKISAGNSHTCILNTLKKVWCWGQNTWGQLGTGFTSDDSNIPIAVVGLSFVTDISLGGMHTCAIDVLSDLFCWGLNAFGQLGLGHQTNKSTPTKVNFENSDVIEVSLGTLHSCVINNLSQVLCWGSNQQGQLGDGTNTLRKTPTLTSLENDASKINLGGYHSCIIDVLSDLWCWGMNTDGQLGLGDNSNKFVPTEVTAVDDVDVAQVSAGSFFTFLVDSNGNIMGTGNNGFGQLGLGDTTPHNIPTPLTL